MSITFSIVSPAVQLLSLVVVLVLLILTLVRFKQHTTPALLFAAGLILMV